MSGSQERFLVGLLVSVVVGCAGRAGPPAGPAVPVNASTERAICAVDEVRSLRARFRATVVTADGRSVADGLLLVRRPGAIRVKLFGFAGFTVHDAIWNGDGERVSGAVSGFGRDEPELIVQTPGEPVVDPAARLSLVLWSLWQARCGRSPEGLDSSGTYALLPGPAQVRSREVDVAAGEVRAERLRWSDEDEIEVRYGDYRRVLGIPLPQRIEFAIPGADWSAEVQVAEYVLGEELPEALFQVPSAASEDRSSGARSAEQHTARGQ